MPRKTYAKNGATCRVTFELPAGVQASSAALCGDFNGWSPSAHAMVERKGGRFSVTVPLASGQSYRYRFLVDGQRWENDWAADAYVENDFGGEDCLVQL
jgi:1,4-alpha-glucan branching enzyme